MDGYDPHRPPHSTGTGSSSRHQQHIPPRQDARIDTQYQAAPSQQPRRRRAATSAAAQPRSQTHLSVPEQTRHRSTRQVHGPEPMIRGDSSGSAGSMTRQFEGLTTGKGEAQSLQKGTQRGRRTKKLDQQTRDHAAKVRGVGACSECRSRKVKCKHRDHLIYPEGNEALLVPSLASPGVSECEESYTPTTNSQCGELPQGLLPGGLAGGSSPCPMSDPGMTVPLEPVPVADMLTGLHSADPMSLSMSPSGMLSALDNNEDDRALQQQIPLRPHSNEHQSHPNLGSGGPWSPNLVYQNTASTYPDNLVNPYAAIPEFTYEGSSEIPYAAIPATTYADSSATPYTGFAADAFTDNSASEYSADCSTERIVVVGRFEPIPADDRWPRRSATHTMGSASQGRPALMPDGAWLCQSPDCVLRDVPFHSLDDLRLHYQTMHESFNEQDAREVYRCTVCGLEPGLHSRRPCDTWSQTWTRLYEYYVPVVENSTANVAGPATFDGNSGGSWTSGGFNGFGDGGYFGGAGSSASAHNPGYGGGFMYGNGGGGYSYRACARNGRIALADDEERAGPPGTGKVVLSLRQWSKKEAASSTTMVHPVFAALVGNCIRRMILEELRKIMSFARLTQDPSPSSQWTFEYCLLGAPCLAACLYGPSRWLVGALTRPARRAETEKAAAAIDEAGEGGSIVEHARVEPATGWQDIWGSYIRCISGV